MASWFSSGVNAISKPFDRGSAFGSQTGFQKNPFSVDFGQSMGNPFSVNFGGSNGNPFSRGMPGSDGSWMHKYEDPVRMFDRMAVQRMEQWESEQVANAGGSLGRAAGEYGQAIASSWLAGGNLDNVSHMINSAANKFGVPPNLLKSIIARESTGDWARDGNRYVYLNERGHNILPYVGITDPAARSWGYDPQQLIGNQAMQIEAAANGLSRLYASYGKDYGWEGVVNVWYSGDPSGGYTPNDSYQYGTTNEYAADVLSFWDRLEAESGGAQRGGMPGGGAQGNWTSAWGGGDYPITQGHGPSEFSLGAGSWMYGYAESVGVQGHPGLDVGMSSGTKLYAPSGGTVVIAGGSGYYKDYRGDGPGRGELRIEMDNGDILILGHMSSINLRPGQRVNAGDYVGNSGSANGDHLHYEVRTRTPGATSSGYTAVDPREYFSGGVSMFSGSNQQTPQRRQTHSGLWWMSDPSILFRR